MSARFGQAPKGRNSSAQGKALGGVIQICFSPERAKQFCSALSGLVLFPNLEPRALPWAIESRAFSAEHLRRFTPAATAKEFLLC